MASEPPDSFKNVSNKYLAVLSNTDLITGLSRQILLAFLSKLIFASSQIFTVVKLIKHAVTSHEHT